MADGRLHPLEGVAGMMEAIGCRQSQRAIADAYLNAAQEIRAVISDYPLPGALAKLEAEQEEFEKRLTSEPALRAFDAVFVSTVWCDDDMPALPDYRRGMEAAIRAATQSEQSHTKEGK